jgi:hypothetical protein
MRGKSGPPGNQNAFRHGLAAIQQRRVNGALTEDEQDIRSDILAGLLADKDGDAQISTAMRVLAEIIASNVSLLVTFNQAIEDVIYIRSATIQKWQSRQNGLNRDRSGYNQLNS